MPSSRFDAYADDRYPLAGFYSRRPAFMRLARRVGALVGAGFEACGYEAVLLPTLIPERIISAQAEHIAGFEPAVYWVTETGRGKPLPEKLALVISSETIFALMFRDWLRDGMALPLRAFQQRSVFRAEHREVAPLMREREFLWFEGHTAFADEASCEAQIEADTRLVEEIAMRLRIPVVRSLRGDAEKCPGALRTYGFDVPTPDGGLNQIASTHYLGQRFAKVFDLRTTSGTYAHQTSFGIGLSRLIAAVIDHNPAAGDADGRLEPTR